ncbi:DNA-directed RNA polymerase III subunit RPC7 [Spea bombifrons]|uniref:DNA-directed RNA polymerase III subunit RPC7 n=1 Tax=Spea bombifrons TaxID=233779 RepID=UPI00234BAC0A|nr:DNA-directed RNA polymerase III subunit RPC7 [Spea bombifrons]
MAGRGRGRGASFTFDLQAIGFSKGESLPETQLQPLPIFPSVEFKPAPLREGDDIDYVLELKQDLRATMKKMPYFIDDKSAKPRVEKYRTKYEIEAAAKLVMEWTPDWRLLPREMKAVKKTVKKRVKKSKVTKPSSSSDDVLKKIEELEKKGDEKSDEENEEKKKEGEEDEEEVEQEIEDEEEHEEENDYIASYFEDGDDFAASDDNMDEATY